MSGRKCEHKCDHKTGHKTVAESSQNRRTITITTTNTHLSLYPTFSFSWLLKRSVAKKSSIITYVMGDTRNG